MRPTRTAAGPVVSRGIGESLKFRGCGGRSPFSHLERPMDDPKYTTLEELLAAAKSGEIPEGSQMTVDNDSVYMYGPWDDDDEAELLWRAGSDATTEHCGNPSVVLIALFRLVGINADAA